LNWVIYLHHLLRKERLPFHQFHRCFGVPSARLANPSHPEAHSLGSIFLLAVGGNKWKGKSRRGLEDRGGCDVYGVQGSHRPLLNDLFCPIEPTAPSSISSHLALSLRTLRMAAAKFFSDNAPFGKDRLRLRLLKLTPIPNRYKFAPF